MDNKDELKKKKTTKKVKEEKVEKKEPVKKETKKRAPKKEVSKKEIKVKEEPVVSEKKETVEIREVVVERKSGFNYAEVIVIMIITLILGGVIGSFVTYISKGQTTTTLPATEVPEELKEFVETYENIVSDYYKEVDTDGLLDAGIKGMLDFLKDDYSIYLDKEETESFNEQVEGKYTGIGVEIVQIEDGVIINRVFENSPAYQAGLKAGDMFLKVDGEDVSKKSSSDISTMIKGSKKDKVSVTVLRDEEEKEFELSLKEVTIDSVISKTFEKNGKKVGYLGISVFAANTNTQFERKLLQLEKEEIDSLIIDVRDNSGGYLTTVTDIASLFMNKSKIIYQLDTKGVVEKVYATTNIDREYPISVLINGNSASASEILAAALKESYGASVVGVNSYGKGTVQKAYQLSSGATVKYTIQKWLTPDGNWLNEVGLEPTHKVELSEDYYKNPTDENDNQLQKALEVISE